MGRSWLHQMRAVPSIYHQCVKFPSPTSEKTIRGSQKQSRICYMSGFRKMPPREENISLVRDPTVKDPDKNLSSIQDSPEKCVSIGNDLSPDIKHDLLSFLKQNIKTFAWSATYMPGIDIDIASHDLNADPTFKPVKQKQRKLGPERANAVNDEVDKLQKLVPFAKSSIPIGS